MNSKKLPDGPQFKSIGPDAGYQMKIYSKLDPRTTNFNKPVLLTEGFDPAYNMAKRCTFDKMERICNDVYDLNGVRTNEAGLVTTLYNEDYDVIMLRFQNPNTSIETNANVVTEAIKWIEAHTKKINGNELVIIGPSMGGLICRYALQQAGQIAGSPTYGKTDAIHVRLLIEFDSPNRGANVPMSSQGFLTFFSPLSEDAAKENSNLNSNAAQEMLLETVASTRAKYDAFFNKLNDPTFRQSIRNLTNYGSICQCPEGSPISPIKIVAIGNGSANGIGHNYPSNFLYANLNIELPPSLGLEVRMRTLEANTMVNCFYGNKRYPKASTDWWVWAFNPQAAITMVNDPFSISYKSPIFAENAPGGQNEVYSLIHDESQVLLRWDFLVNNYNDEFLKHDGYPNKGKDCFIPTPSAAGILDPYFNVGNNSHYYKAWPRVIEGPMTMFDKVYLPEQNQDHVQITTENKNWFLNEIRASGLKCKVSVGFAANNGQSAEDGRQVIIPVGLNYPAYQTVTVRYKITDATATQGSDYTIEPASGILVFNAGQTTPVNELKLNIADDNQIENDKFIKIALTDPVNAGLGGYTNYTYTLSHSLQFESYIRVHAKGTIAGNGWPQVEVWSGKQILKEFAVNTPSFMDYFVFPPRIFDLEANQYVYVRYVNEFHSNFITMQRWATQQGGYWDSQKWIPGDFNGDGKHELACIYNDGGNATIGMHLSTGYSFIGAPYNWGIQQGGFWDSQKWVAGDFNGDGKCDLANIFNDNGMASIDVHFSTGSGFVMQRWATRQGGFWDSQKWVAGDFNGDGKCDLAVIINDGGSATIGMHLSTGSSFQGVPSWATKQGGFWDSQKWIAGDFNGDGKADLANIFNDNNLASIDVHYSTGASFNWGRWATQQGGFWDSQKWIAGDFNGDGKHELACIYNDGGNATIGMHLSTGSSFQGVPAWATQQGGFWDSQKWVVGDFNGDGRADLANIFNDNNTASIDVHFSDHNDRILNIDNVRISDYVIQADDPSVKFISGPSMDGTTILPGRKIIDSQGWLRFPVRKHYNLVVNVIGNGSVISDPIGINCGSTCTARFLPGTSIKLTATPATGYAFTGWSGSGCSGTGACTFNLNTNTTVTATFTALPHTITSTQSPNGTLTPSGAQKVVDRSNITFTIIPQTGFQICDVLVDGHSVGKTTSYTFYNVTADHSITASFCQCSISGTIVDESGKGMKDVTLLGLPNAISTDGNGSYHALLPCGWAGTVTPTMNTTLFSPSSRTYAKVNGDTLHQDFIVMTEYSRGAWPMFGHDYSHSGSAPLKGPLDSSLAWTFNVGASTTSSPAIDTNGTIYIGSQDSCLYAINPDGSLKWRFKTSGGISSSPAIGNDGATYFGSKDGSIYAVDKNGQRKWAYQTSGEVNSSPVIDMKGILHIGSNNARIYSIKPSGALVDSFLSDGRILSTPAVLQDGSICFASCDINRLYLLNPDFSLKWKTETHSNVITSSPALSRDDKTVFYGSDDGFLYARNTSDGSIKWKGNWFYGGYQSSPAIGKDGTVYIGSQYGNLLAINPEDGSQKWNYYMALSVLSAPAIASDSIIYFTSGYGGLFAMNFNGTVKWNIANFDKYGHFFSSPAIGNNGWLYVGSTNGKIYAFNSFNGKSSKWAPQNTPKGWSCLTSSASGQLLAATSSAGRIYTSSDYGVTWLPRDSSTFGPITSSSNGQYLVSGTWRNQIYTSSDYGATWIAHGPTGQWLGVASSADGQRLAAAEEYSSIYTSKDFGATWVSHASPVLSGSTYWTTIASSGDGKFLYAGGNGTNIYSSSDYGETWVAHDLIRSWTSITTSADGKNIAAVTWDSHIYTSNNYGVTWTARDTSANRLWYSIACSSDGQYMAAGADGDIFLSSDAGATWTALGSYGAWHGITLSADGRHMAAGGIETIYTDY